MFHHRLKLSFGFSEHPSGFCSFTWLRELQYNARLLASSPHFDITGLGHAWHYLSVNQNFHWHHLSQTIFSWTLEIRIEFWVFLSQLEIGRCPSMDFFVKLGIVGASNQWAFCRAWLILISWKPCIIQTDQPFHLLPSAEPFATLLSTTTMLHHAIHCLLMPWRNKSSLLSLFIIYEILPSHVINYSTGRLRSMNQCFAFPIAYCTLSLSAAHVMTSLAYVTNIPETLQWRLFV